MASYSFRRSQEANPKLATAEGRNVTWNKQKNQPVKWMFSSKMGKMGKSFFDLTLCYY